GSGGGGSGSGSSSSSSSSGGGGSSSGAAGSAAAAGAGALGLLVSTVAVWLAGAVLVGVVLLLLWSVIRGLTERESKPKPVTQAALAVAPAGGAAPAPALPTDARLQAARDAAAKGRYGEAVALLLGGLTDRVELAGLIRPRRGLTAREYLRAARPDPALHPALKTVVQVYEPLGYGRRPGRIEQYAEAEAAYLAGVSDRAVHDSPPAATGSSPSAAPGSAAATADGAN
ncbi:MAG: DUF4129 domain-containing protein, partial [Planctomycetota bacterium]